MKNKKTKVKSKPKSKALNKALVSKSLPSGLDIEDFGFDSRAFELYKQGKHPLQTR